VEVGAHCGRREEQSDKMSETTSSETTRNRRLGSRRWCPQLHRRREGAGCWAPLPPRSAAIFLSPVAFVCTSSMLPTTAGCFRLGPCAMSACSAPPLPRLDFPCRRRIRKRAKGFSPRVPVSGAGAGPGAHRGPPRRPPCGSTLPLPSSTRGAWFCR
jgi:hypothetical protein